MHFSNSKYFCELVLKQFKFHSFKFQIIIFMSFFSKTEIKDLKGNHQRIIRIAVSNVPINPTIAITTSNKIHLFNQSGDKHQYELSRSITPTCIEWHPTNPILAIGWDNGRITIWNEDTKAPKEEGKPHQDPIMLIKFNPSGNRMVTSDLTGTIGVWRGINLLAVYQKEWAITHCVFCDLNIEGVKTNLGNLFLFAGRSGTVCLANDMNMCSDVCRVGGTIKALMFYQKEGSAIVITSNLLLVQFKINFTQKSVPEKKVKLSISGEPQNLSSIWIGESLLSTCSNENMIRFWHLQADQNYNLTVFDVLNADSMRVNMATDKISSIVYDNRGRSLVAGTREGRLMFWKNMALGTDSPVDKDQWSPQPILALGKQIQTLTVGRNNGVIVCKQNDGQVVIVSETKISAKMNGNYKAILKGTDKIEISYEDNKDKFLQTHTTSGHIKGFDFIADKLLYWTSKKIEILEISKSSQLNINSISSIEQKALRCLFVSKDSFIITTDYGFNMLSLTGQVKQTLVSPESQGKVSGIQIMNNYIVSWTQQSYIRVFTIGNEIKQAGLSRRFEDSKSLIGNIKSCSINANGKKVGVVSNSISNNGSSVNHSFHIYDIDTDSFIGYDLGKDYIPVTIYWDKKEVRYFGVQVQTSKAEISKGEQTKEDEGSEEDTQQQDKQEEQKQSNRQFLTFFYTNETGIKHQDKFVLKSSSIDIFALKIPHFYSIERVKEDYIIKKTTLHDFQKINHDDETIKNSILNFSFHLTSGNLDQAYKSVKNIQNPAIWQKMAIMCVKCKRLDVAQICIGNMKFARGARSIREAKKQPQIETQLAMVAIQLGMVDEAKALYENSTRYDLYSKICQSNAEIEKSIEVSQKYDRINLKNTYYNSAKFYQASGRYDQAIEFYQKSNTHIKEVPRMFLQAGRIKELIEYVDDKKDKKLYTWLGQYNQSIGNLQQAIKYYEEGESTSNLVRLYLSQNQVQESMRICQSDSEPQACFLLARHLQKNNMLSEAIHFYAKAQYYSQAIKIAITNQLDGQIMSLSMASPKEVAFRSASYFERKGLVEKAIRLYIKAGAIKKSNNLAQKNGFTELITNKTDDDSQNQQDLIEGGDKTAINAKISSLLEANKYERAVPLLISSKQYERALDVCIQQNVPIQEDLIKKIIPDEEPSNPLQKSKRADLIKTVAEKCRKQGSFELASNLYLKIADKITSLKCLIELGDPNKVIAFANTARSSETFVLAANFLQTADWHQNPQYMKNIIMFYQKAKAFQNLSSFFQACANVEIDEYRDYQKACAALKQAIKHISKVTTPDKEGRLQVLNHKRDTVQKFIDLKDLAESNPSGMVQGCLSLLREPDIQQSVRRGDLFAIIIEYYFEMGDYKKCLQKLKQMKDMGIIITPYIDKQIIDTVNKKLGIATKKKAEIQEEVIEDLSS